MLCPYCHSASIIYDFELGYTVCSSCGTVLETLFIEHYETEMLSQSLEKHLGLPSVRKGLEKKRAAVKMSILSKMSKDIAMYEKYARKARKNVYVDFEAVLKKISGHATARIYRHKDEEKALSILDQDPVTKLVMERVIDRDPILASRTLRGKIALALIIRSLITSPHIDLNDVCSKTSMSLVHVRRLLSLAKKRLPHIRHLLLEVARDTGIESMVKAVN